MKEIAKAYNPKETEDKIYKLWEEADAFKPYSGERKADGGKPFAIVIPPPNVTGSLHMGHALNTTIQDILIRRARMTGVPTLWLPGTDHAGIATQNVVDKQLSKEGINKNDLSREEFEKRIWAWVDEYGHIIIDQLKKIGATCDWSRQRFTLDDDYTEAVNTAFKHYYDKGLIYQGERVVNWCVGCQTAISDIEVEYKEQQAKLYFFKYDKNFPITIATTRPETKLGDMAVAVNPNDTRYKDFVGKTFDIDFAGIKRTIKIITDRNVDPKFGTGALGVTPAHSITDAEIAQNNNLSSITIIDKYGCMTKEAGKDYEGLKVRIAREKVLEWLEKENLLEKSEEIVNNLSVCYRCGKEIEPQPSKQWFLKMGELIKPAIEAINTDKIKLTPTRWKKVYLDWMENIRDWCISRQIIWGHKLPVFEKQEQISNLKFQISNQFQNSKIETLNENSKLKIENSEENNQENFYVGSNPPPGYEQSSDVLDTWFSSALWPFAVFLKKNRKSKIENRKSKLGEIFSEDSITKDLELFYPTSILSTARDINMLWVVRMIFSGLEFTKEIPFEQVYIHPTVFNKDGKRMSKSLGTGVDPLELIDKYGADAVRFGLAYINTGTQDIKFDETAILMGQKFANKIWNVARFTILQMQNAKIKNQNDKEKIKIETDSDKIITQSLEILIKSVNSDLDNFRFGQAAHNLYDFIWHDFADKYIEESKKDSNPEVLLFVLRTSLLLLHPFMPYLTELIWQNLYEEKLVAEKLLITAEWPHDDRRD